RCVVPRRAQQTGRDGLRDDAVEIGLDTPDRRFAGVDRIHLPAGSGRVALDDDDPGWAVAALANARVSKERGHRHPDDAGADHRDLTDLPGLDTAVAE